MFQSRSPLPAAAGIIILAAAVLFRAPGLSVRTFHGDEGVNALKTAQLHHNGYFEYDPLEYHGPALFFAAIPTLFAQGDPAFPATEEGDYRVTTVIFGALLVALTLLTAPLLGRPAAIVAGLLVAASPSLVFYSRYFIHEMLLTTFAAAMLISSWRFTQTGSRRWAALCGLSIGLMHATKETFILSVAALGAAALASRLDPSSSRLRLGDLIRRLPLLIGVAAIVSITLFSSFFGNWPDVLDSIKTYTTYLARGAGGEAAHNHPFEWYFKRFFFHRTDLGIFSEWPLAALAVIGLPIAWRHGHFARFIAVYTVALALIYSTLSYKTPWCFINVIHPMTILGGIGASWLIRRRPKALGAMLALGIGALAAALAWESYQVNYRFGADSRNPYIYGHSVPDIRRLGDRVDQFLKFSSSAKQPPVVVVSDENYWPLPYYLRKARDVDYLTIDKLDASPAIVIADQDQETAVLAKVKGDYQVERFGLRRGQMLSLIVRGDLWLMWQHALDKN